MTRNTRVFDVAASRVPVLWRWVDMLWAVCQVNLHKAYCQF